MSSIFKFFGEIGLKSDEFDSGLKGVRDGAESTASGMTDKFKKAAIAIGSVFAVGKVIDFGKMAVEAAASAEALQSQFEQVFGEMQGPATEMIDGMANEFGMLPERVMPGFTQLTSMFKGVGMDAEDAMATAEKATTAAADAAAFYDTSMESAQGSVTSFVKGNYEAGESIGIFANDAQMAQHAIETGVVSSTKEWKALDEATKQATRVDYINNMQEQSGAMGQASREADGLENVMGNLRAVWQKFLAVVGAPILKLVIPVLQAIIDSVLWLVDVIQPATEAISAFFEGLKNGDSKSGFLKNVTKVFKDIYKVIEPAVEVVKSFFDMLFGSQSEKDNIDLMTSLGISPEMAQGVIDFATSIGEAFTSMKDVATEMWNLMTSTIATYIDVLVSVWKSIFDTVAIWWSENQNGILATVSTVWETIMSTLSVAFEFLSGLFFAVWEPLKTFLVENQDLIRATFVTVWNAILAVIKFVMDYIVPYLVTAWNNIMLYITPILEYLKNSISTQFNFILGIIKAVMQLIQGDWSGAWDTIVQTAKDYVTSLVESVTGLMGGLLEAIVTHVTSMYNAVAEWFGKIAPYISEKWGEVTTFLSSINLFEIGGNIISGLWEGMKGVWNNLQSWLVEKLDWLPQFMKDDLGIQSPSTVMRDEIGKWIPIGLANGITGAMGYVDKAMTGMSSIVSDTSFDVPDVSMASDYTFAQAPQPTTSQKNNRGLMEETNFLLRKLLDKDTDVKLNSRSLAEELLDDINYLNELYNNRDTRIRGGVTG